MASVRVPYDAIILNKPFIKGMETVESVAARILDNAVKEFWMESPWRWTLGALETVTLVANTQDYSLTSPSTGPTDFLYVVQAYTTDGVGPTRDLEIVPVLPVDANLLGQPSKIAFIAGSPAKIRVHPVPGALINTTKIISIYKKTAPYVDRSTMYSTMTSLGLPEDEWFHVYCDLVLYHLYKYADDQRAGGVTMTPNGPQYTGQLGTYKAKVWEMTQREKLPIWDSRDQSAERPKISK